MTNTNELYILTGNLAELKNMILEAENPQEVEQLLADTIQATEESISAELEALIAIQREHEAEALKFKTEKDYFAKKQSENEHKADAVKKYIGQALAMVGADFKNKKKIETKFGKVGFQKNPPSIVVTDSMNIPMEFEKIVEPQYDMKALMAHIKEAHGINGDEDDFTEMYGVKIVNNSAHVRIR